MLALKLKIAQLTASLLGNCLIQISRFMILLSLSLEIKFVHNVVVYDKSALFLIAC